MRASPSGATSSTSCAIAGIGYVHEPALAPTKDILDAYRNKQIDWSQYESAFKRLLEARRPQEQLTPDGLDWACLLCSEPTAEHCHRRLVAEYLQQQWNEIAIEHLYTRGNRLPELYPAHSVCRRAKAAHGVCRIHWN